MKKIHKSIWTLALLASINVLAGCSKEETVLENENLSKVGTISKIETASGTETTLWVITEQTTSDSINYQAEQAAKSFEEKYDGITVRIDILPTNEKQREIYLKQLRTQIMAGDGPDVYLLPTSNVLTMNSPTKYTQKQLLTQVEVDPLFPDVTQAMYNGVFSDISSFYDGDTDLNVSALHPDVMDAGVIDDSRYVLPLRYTMPVILTDSFGHTDAGISPELIRSGIDALVEYAHETNDMMMAIGLQMPDNTTLLPQLFDYKKGEIVITKQEIADYMLLYQQWNAMSAVPAEQFVAEHLEELRIYLDEALHYSFEDVLSETITTVTLSSFNSVMEYGRYAYHWSLEGFPLYADTLPGVLEQSALSKVLEKELEAHPMRSIDGAIVAEVTYYGAVGSGCEKPALAYDFLRTFLTEDYQWDLVRPRAPRTDIDFFNLPQEQQVDGLIENSWPVRTDGSTQYLWDSLQYQNFHDDSGMSFSKNLMRQLKSQDLDVTDADIPILDVAIDEVRFPICQPYAESLSYALTLLNNEDGTPTEVDIDELAEQIYRYLWWHLAEG